MDCLASFRAAAHLCLVVLCSLILSGTVVAAESKPIGLALAIGNSHYHNAPLANPGNDAQGMAEKLRQAGFSVTLRLDADRRQLQETIREFTSALAKSRLPGVFYYAGHGVQLNWRNFLIPVDARIRNKADIQSQAVDLGMLLDGLGRARNPLNIVILDACRNNPFGADFRLDEPGLSQLDAPGGTLLAYATAPGNTAEDGEGSHGLYTGTLLQEMQVPGAAVEDVFKRVRLAVRMASQGGQIPWEATSLETDFAFNPASSIQDSAKEFEADLALWLELRQAQSAEALVAFIRQRPSGKFSELAQFRLDQLLHARGEKPVESRRGQTEACPPPAAVAATPPGPPVPFRVGERYDYRTVDLLSHREKGHRQDTVTKVTADEVHFGEGGKVTDMFGNDVRAPDGRHWTPYQFFIHDYRPGKHWPAQFRVKLADGREVNMSFDLRVVGRERITVPAGTFDAYRIEAQGTNLDDGSRLERTAWVAPDQMRGFVAMELVTRRNGQVVAGERIELTGHRLAAGSTTAVRGGSLFSY